MVIRRYIFLLTLILSASQSWGQQGTWADHLSYYSATGLVLNEDMAYVAAGAAIFSYNLSNGEIKKLSKVNGLTESGVQSIGYSTDTKSLIIGYESSNVDIYYKGVIYNMPDILRANIPGEKAINRIRTAGKYAYVCCSFGIVVIDLSKREVYDTWRPTADNNKVYDIALTETTVYAATSKGVWSASINSQGLSYSGNWSRIQALPSPDGDYRFVVNLGNNIFTLHRPDASGGDLLYRLDQPLTPIFSEPGIIFNGIDVSENKLVLASRNKVMIMDSSGTIERNISDLNWGDMNARQAVLKGSDIFIADGLFGLFKVYPNETAERFVPEGPWFSKSLSIISEGPNTYITGGSVDNAWNNTWTAFQLFHKKNDLWATTVRYDIHDAMRIAIDPSDNEHFFVSTWGAGLIEFRGDEVVRIYDENNSPLQSIIPGNSYERICGLAFDSENNLWITHSGMPGSIKVLKKDNSWITIPVTIDAPTIGDIIISKTGLKWIVLPRGHGLFVYDDNKTPDLFTDDRYKKIVVIDNDNKLLNSVYSIAEDLDGAIWIGTDQGPAIYFNPGKVFDNDIKAYRVKVPRNDGSGFADFLLGNEIITSIAVDGGNRKWLATNSSGLFQVSPDGITTLKQFNEDNSPLLSNSISSVSVNGSDGNVWIATSKGVISYSGNATEGGKGYAGMYAFPNPVRPDFSGPLTVTGLERGTSVRITDVSGNLVFAGISNGGMATWDLKNRSGRRVASGVYLIFCSSSDGQQAGVTKVLIISQE